MEGQLIKMENLRHTLFNNIFKILFCIISANSISGHTCLWLIIIIYLKHTGIKKDTLELVQKNLI